MLRVLHVGNMRPTGRTVDPGAIFQPGMIGQLKKVGGDIVLGVSDGLAPFGIIQDLRDTAYVQPVIDEIVVVVPNGTDGTVVTVDTIGLLKNSSILQSTFASDINNVSLIANNGAIIVRAGTELNYKSEPLSAGFDSVRIRVRYSYYVPNKPGDDTTMGSGKVSIWASPSGCIFATDQFDTTVDYPLNAGLYVSNAGMLTSEQMLQSQPTVAMVTVPPTSINPTLEFIWL